MLQKNIIVNNLNIRYYRSEDIDPDNIFVFLHGWGSNVANFGETLQKCRSFVALDLPGFGNSEMPQAPWSLSDYVSFLEKFLDKTDIQNPIIVGHSMGGSIAIKYCAGGGAVKKIILVGSAGIRKKSMKKFAYYIIAKFFKMFFALLPGIKKFREDIRRRFYKNIGSDDYLNAGQLVGTYRKVISEDLQEDLKKINVPSILIWGENDKDTPLKDGRLMHELIKNSELHVVKNAGHYVFLDNRKDFEKIFLSHIK